MPDAISRSHASHGAAKASPPIGFDRGDEEWIPALIAFYRIDCSFQRAEGLAKGWFGLDGTDRRTIEALKAAFEVAP